jgi:hypothetical protein
MRERQGASPKEILNNIRNEFVNTNKSNKINVIDDENKIKLYYNQIVK